MATINASSSADIIVPSNGGTTYRGLGGDDTYIISNAASGNITIVDTNGSNTIQLVDGLSIASSKFAADSVQLTLSSGAVITVNGGIVPCCFDREGVIDLGSCRKMSLDDILADDRAQNLRKGFQQSRIVEDLCKRCTYRERFN